MLHTPFEASLSSRVQDGVCLILCSQNPNYFLDIHIQLFLSFFCILVLPLLRKLHEEMLTIHVSSVYEQSVVVEYLFYYVFHALDDKPLSLDCLGIGWQYITLHGWTLHMLHLYGVHPAASFTTL